MLSWTVLKEKRCHPEVPVFKTFTVAFWYELKRMVTDRHLIVVCFLAPFFYVLMLTSVYSQKRLTEVPVGIADSDNTSISRQAALYLDSTENLKVFAEYPSPQAAHAALINGDIYGYFYFPPGFASDIKKGKSASYRVAADYMNIALANPVFLASADVAGELTARHFSALPGRPRLSGERAEAMQNLVRPEVHTIFNREMNYSDFFLPGLLAIIMQQLVLVGLCLRTAEDRQENLTGDYWRISGGSPLTAAAARALPYMLLNYILCCLFAFVWLRHFDLVPAHSIPDAMLYIFAYIAAGTSFGLLISPFFRRTADVLLFLMYFSMGAFLISGYSWPDYMLPAFHRIVALPIPSTYFMSWLRRAYGAALPPSYSTPDFWILCGLSVLYFVLSLPLFRKIYGGK